MNPLIPIIAIGALLMAKRKQQAPTEESSSEDSSSEEGAESPTPSLPTDVPQGAGASSGGGGQAPSSTPVPGVSTQTPVPGMTDAQVEREKQRIVKESREILNGQRDSYSGDSDADMEAAIKAARAAASQEAQVPPPKPISVNSQPAPTTSKPTASKPTTVVDVYGPTVAPAAAQSSSSSSSSMPPKQAAQELAAHASALLKAGRGAELGVKGKPSATVAKYQALMGGITADGMYGPATRTRGQQLGVSMPVRK